METVTHQTERVNVPSGDPRNRTPGHFVETRNSQASQQQNSENRDPSNNTDMQNQQDQSTQHQQKDSEVNTNKQNTLDQTKNNKKRRHIKCLKCKEKESTRK